VARLVREGPTLSEHGVVRWRRMDLSRVIQTRFGVRLAERSVGALLRRLGFRRLSARPRHPGHDAAAQEAHKNVWPAPSASRFRDLTLASLHQRIRPVGTAPAKMEIRAFRSS